MKRKYLLICCFLSLSLIISCAKDANVIPGVDFDEKEFNEQKAKWQSMKINDYCFEYEFANGTYPSYVKGIVTVSDGTNKVELECESNPNEDLSESSVYYLSDINSVFEAVHDAYKKSLEVSKKNSSHIWYKIEYNSEYGFPESVSNSELKPDNNQKLSNPGESSGDFGLQINKFEIDVHL